MNKAVLEMLTKPPRMKVAETGGMSEIGSAMFERMVEAIEEQAEKDAMAKMKPTITALEAKVEAAEAKVRALEAEAGAHAAVMDGMNKALSERDASDKAAAEYARNSESTTASLMSDVSRLTAELAASNARCGELDKRCAELSAINARTKPAPVVVQKPVPQFDVQVTARDAGGAIQTVSIKPRN
jgi:chromosome segregation ATPase